MEVAKGTSLALLFLLLLQAHGWENTHLFGDVCWTNASSVLQLQRGDSSSAVVGLRYPLETAHNCSFAVTSDSGALIVVVRLLNLRRDPNGTCLDHVTLEQGPGHPLLFEGPRCSTVKGDTMHALARGVVRVRLQVTPPVERIYTGLNIAFTTFLQGNHCDSRDMFRCASGDDVCIPRRWTCNGINNCGDESDEPRHLSSEPCRVDPGSIWGPVVFTTLLVAFLSVLLYVAVLDICMARVSFSTTSSSTTSSTDTSASSDATSGGSGPDRALSPVEDNDCVILLGNAELVARV
ncbi:low-density lipoprotein receptor-related protein 3-like [Amblyomma americanum]